MNKPVNTVWDSADAQRLSSILTDITESTEMRNFLRDVMTEKEIIEISSRLRAAQMLSQNKKYADIITATKLSSRTVARISEWMKDGTGGYSSVLTHHSHLPPA